MSDPGPLCFFLFYSVVSDFLPISVHVLRVNPVALRKAKIVYILAFLSAIRLNKVVKFLLFIFLLSSKNNTSKT